MNWVDTFATRLWAGLLYVVGSAAFAVFAGVLAKHALEVQAGKHQFFGPYLWTRIVTGVFCVVIASGVNEYMAWTGAIANAAASLIGFAGPELVLSIALARLRAKGIITDPTEDLKQ